MASFKQLAESDQSLLTEAFNSKPYETTMTKKSAGDVFFTFEDEDGKEYRVQFYTSGGLGKQVRRVYVGEKQGNVYKDAIKGFKNPMRVIATMIKATEEYLKTPLGKSIQGLAIDLSKKAAPKGVRLIKQIVKRSKVIKKYLDVIDSDLTVDPGRGVVWTVRKGVDAGAVYDGKKVAGLLGGGESGDEVDTAKGDDLKGVMASKMFDSLEPLLRQSLSFYGEWTFEDQGNMILKGRFHGNGYEFRVGVNPDKLKYIFEGSLYNTITPIVDHVKAMIEPIEPEVNRGHDSSEAQTAVDNVMEGLIGKVSEYVKINFNTKSAWSRDSDNNMFKGGEIEGYAFNITIENEGDFMWTVALTGSKFGRSKLGSTQNFEALNIWKWFKQIKPEWAEDVETMNDEVEISLGLSTLTAYHDSGETIRIDIGTPEQVAGSTTDIKAIKAWEFAESGTATAKIGAVGTHTGVDVVKKSGYTAVVANGDEIATFTGHGIIEGKGDIRFGRDGVKGSWTGVEVIQGKHAFAQATYKFIARVDGRTIKLAELEIALPVTPQVEPELEAGQNLIDAFGLEPNDDGGHEADIGDDDWLEINGSEWTLSYASNDEPYARGSVTDSGVIDTIKRAVKGRTEDQYDSLDDEPKPSIGSFSDMLGK